MSDVQSSDIQKSEHPCSICAKRKVKCDRLIPCTNCVKRGKERECIGTYNSQRNPAQNITPPEILQFWQKYEYWIMDIELLKTYNIDVMKNYADISEDLHESTFWISFLTREQSFQLLDYSMEKLGALYFGCISDISELYLLLEEHWQRRDAEKELDEEPLLLSSDEYFSEALIWSIFTLAVFYMPMERLITIFPSVPLNQMSDVGTEKHENQEMSEDRRPILVKLFTKCALVQLYRADFMSIPDIRLIQVYLILSNTSFHWTNFSLANNIRLQCFQVAKSFHMNEFRPLIDDSTALRLTKMMYEKLWYRLCVCDYFQANPNQYIVFHIEISSLLQHAAYLEDLPNVDVYQSEQNFEVFFWKLISLDRDLDQYLDKDIRPPLKTLDAIQRQIEIFNEKLKMEQESEILKFDFEKFLITYLLKVIAWKLYKMYFLYHDISNSLHKSIHYAKSMISLIVKNIKQSKNIIFNSFPIVFQSIIRMSSFYAFLTIFKESNEINNLNLDVSELINNLPEIFKFKIVNLQYLLGRLKRLKEMRETIHLLDSDNLFHHPVVKILQNDIKTVSWRYKQSPIPVRSSTPVNDGYEHDSTIELSNKSEIHMIVSNFQSMYPVEKIIS